MKREQVMPQVMVDLAARVAKGAAEYGEPLTAANGRDALQDAYEEALDMCLYLKQALMERVRWTELPSPRLSADCAEHVKRFKEQQAALAAGAWPGPDWSRAPEWAEWFVCQRGNYPFWLARKPQLVDYGDNERWFFNGPVAEAPGNAFYCDWRQSLRKRPE